MQGTRTSEIDMKDALRHAQGLFRYIERIKMMCGVFGFIMLPQKERNDVHT